MGIVTKKGDRGLTYLRSGENVRKDNIRIEACGALDELCSFLGMAKCLTKDRKTSKLIESVQKDIFVIGGEIATMPSSSKTLEHRIDRTCTDRLERAIIDIERKDRRRRRSFSLPGANLVSSALDVARTIARKAERTVVALDRRSVLGNRFIIIYLNRLSDLLYLIARCHEPKHKKSEAAW